MPNSNLNSLCKKYLSKVTNERLEIQKKIDSRYFKLKNDKDYKKKLKSEFYKDIEDFKEKYRYNLVGIINPKTNEVVGIDTKCSDELEKISKYLESYIDDVII